MKTSVKKTLVLEKLPGPGSGYPLAFFMLGFGLASAIGCSSDDSPMNGSGAAGQGAGGSAAFAGHPSNGASGSSANSSIAEQECAVVGEICHAVDDKSGPLHECHEIGHARDQVACHAQFADCVGKCVAAAEQSPGPENGGGAGASSGEPQGDPYCASLGELCHSVDDKNGPLHACHEVGHDADGSVCRAEFDRCATICLAAREQLEMTPSMSGSSNSEGGSPSAGASGADGS